MLKWNWFLQQHFFIPNLILRGICIAETFLLSVQVQFYCCKVFCTLHSKHISEEIWMQFYAFRCGFLSFNYDIRGGSLNTTNQMIWPICLLPHSAQRKDSFYRMAEEVAVFFDLTSHPATHPPHILCHHHQISCAATATGMDYNSRNTWWIFTKIQT